MSVSLSLLAFSSHALPLTLKAVLSVPVNFVNFSSLPDSSPPLLFFVVAGSFGGGGGIPPDFPPPLF